MIDSSGSAEWSASYAQYYLRAAQQSARTQGLYYLVLQRVSRGELSPTTMRDALSAFSEQRGRSYGDRLNELSARFLAGLVQIATGATQPPPAYDALDPYSWFRRLTEYAAEQHRHSLQWYQRGLDSLTAGTEQSPTTIVDEYNRRTSEQVRALGRLYFDVLGGLTDISTTAEEEYLRSVLAGVAADEPPSSVVQLAAPPGASATAEIALENTRADPAAIRCMVSDVRRADGVGPAFAPKIVVDPDALMLDPNQERSVRLSLMLDPTVYEPGADYVGAVYVLRHGEPQLDLPMRIRALASAPGAAVDRGTTS
ncbi:MAG TPA: hypothetical protein VFB92_28180 [Vicinamibacterales bacterium]|jgi:hypothetical protein|nr:hypothetical protein [Vicinamibacterales bacterium]